VVNDRTVAAIVLCGGRSTRMGRDKASLPFGDGTILERVLRSAAAVTEDIVVAAAPSQAVRAGYPVSRDEHTDVGPLPALAQALDLVHATDTFVLACDLPLLQPGVLSLLLELSDGWEGAVPFIDGRRLPTCAVFQTAALRLARDRFGDPRHGSLHAFVAGLRIRDVPLERFATVDPGRVSFSPCNTPEEYSRALARAGEDLRTGCRELEAGTTGRPVSLETMLEADGHVRAGLDGTRWLEFVEHVAETLDIGPGTRVWDAGCGAGAFLYPLSLNGYEVGGADSSADRVSIAAAAMPDGQFLIGSPLECDPVGHWDVVVSSGGFSHCRDRHEVRRLITRMVAAATHSVALLRVEEDSRAAVDRTALLGLLTNLGASAVRFETADGRLDVYASVRMRR
jgi:molybdopterin-guanine dinucleotide biosynthesis protein A